MKNVDGKGQGPYDLLMHLYTRCENLKGSNTLLHAARYVRQQQTRKEEK